MFLKKIKKSKSIAVALSAIMLFVSFQGDVFAMENLNNKDTKQELSNEEKVRRDISKVEAKYGGEIKYDENKNLSGEEIAKRFDIINSTYNVGEAFSDKDAEFIVHYADNQADIKARNTTTKSFNKKKTAFNITVQIQGSTRATHNIMKNSYGATFNSKVIKGSHTKSLQNVVTHSAYGLIGNGGTYVGLVHNSTMGNTTTSSWKPSTGALYTNSDKKYTAAVLYANTNAYVKVTSKAGSVFTLYAYN